MSLRYASTAVGVFLVLIIAAGTIWGGRKLSRVSTQGAHILSFICLLVCIVGTYRLSNMFHKTTSLTSRGPGTLNSRGAKAAFYILHALPEWLAITVIFSFNMRQIFGTGMWGDYRAHDETPKEREKREKRQAKKAEKKQKLLSDKTVV